MILFKTHVETILDRFLRYLIFLRYVYILRWRVNFVLHRRFVVYLHSRVFDVLAHYFV